MSGKEFQLVLSLVAGGIVLLLVVLNLGLRGSEPGVVRYPWGARLLGMAFLAFPIPLVALLAADWKATRPEDRPLAVGLCTAFLAMGIGFWLEFQFVRHTYDATGLSYRTPWSRRQLKWAEVTTVEWRASMQWLDLVAGSKRHHLSTMLKGLPGFAEAALRGIPTAVLARSPEGTAMLERLRDTGSPLQL